MAWNASGREADALPTCEAAQTRRGRFAPRALFSALALTAIGWGVARFVHLGKPLPRADEPPAKAVGEREKTPRRDGIPRDTSGPSRVLDMGRAVVREGAGDADTPRRRTWAQLYGRGVAVTNDLSGGRSRYEIGKRRSENELVFLACAPVGTMVVGDTAYDGDFIRDLHAALDEETPVDPEDDAARTAMKGRLAAVKAELRSLREKGADLAEVLRQTRSELQDLGVYKFQIERLVVDFQDGPDERSDEDIESFVRAANLMLEEKGIEPFHFNAVTREILKHKPMMDDLQGDGP